MIKKRYNGNIKKRSECMRRTAVLFTHAVNQTARHAGLNKESL
jgi:hypothetical protein